MISKIIALLAALVAALQGLARRKEQREAQDERDQIDDDSAKHAADKFGDGRVHPLPERKADQAKRPDGDGG